MMHPDLSRLLLLEPGWDGGTAGPCSAAAVAAAERFIRECVPSPARGKMQVVPTLRRGLQLEWHCNGLDLEVAVAEDGSITAACEDALEGHAWEGPLARCGLLVHALLRAYHPISPRPRAAKVP